MKLAKELDGLPLALATAGAYLSQTAISISDYYTSYKESWASLQETSPEVNSYEDRTLYSTWQVSFNHVKQRSQLSAKLLQLWAYFDNQDIWLELLQYSNPEDPAWIRELKHKLNFHHAMRILLSHGLVEVNIPLLELTESQGYSIHGCVHSWVIYVLNREWDRDLAKLAVRFVASHAQTKPEDIQPWLTQRRLLQHASRCSYILLNGLVREDGMEWVYFNLGILYSDQRKLAEAEQMYKRALRGYEKALEPENTSMLDVGNNLGLLYADQGRLGEAEQMYERVLRGREKALGPKDTSTLETVNNLGLLYTDQGRLDEAEQMFERALQGFEKALGPENTSTLEAVNNLGMVYTDQGKLDEAEDLYKRALRGREKALGPKHTSTLETINNLGIFYAKQSRLDEAEQMYKQALQGFEKALGPEHPSTLQIINNLGILYVNQDKLSEAKQMYEQALRGYEMVIHPDNITTYIPVLDTTWGLGSLYAHQGNLSKAKEMYTRALEGYMKVGGPDHPRSQTLRGILRDLDIVEENDQGNGEGERVSEPFREETSSSKNERDLSNLNLG